MKYLLITIFSLITIFLSSQNYIPIDTVVRYFEGYSEPPADWNNPNFDDSDWNVSLTLPGYVYFRDYSNEDSISSVYFRTGFNIEDKSAISEMMMIAEYTDGYIAYINGIEVARINMGQKGTNVAYNKTAERSAPVYGRSFNDLFLGIYLDSTILQNVLVDGKNSFCVQMHNDSVGGYATAFGGILVDVTNLPYDVYGYHWRGYKQVELDSSHLPIAKIEILDDEAFRSSDIRYDAQMQIISNNSGFYNKINDTTYNYKGAIGIETRGQSSLGWAKKNFRIETHDNIGENNNVSLLGMPDDNDWILHGPLSDRSLMRNALAYTLGGRIMKYSPRGRYVDLLINGEYMGVYYLMETIKRDKNRVDVKKLTPESEDITGGYIMRWDKKQPNSIEIVYPKSDNITQAQQDYITDFYADYRTSLNPENLLDPENGYRKYIARPSFIDFTILNELTKNCDAYKYSTYMYKDRDDEGKKIHYGPIWDFDLAFGNSTFQNGHVLEGWQFHQMSNQRLDHRKLFQDTALVNEFIERWFSLRQGSLHLDSIFATMDSIQDYLGDANQRNFDVWPMEGRHMGLWGFSFAFSYEEEMQKLKNWLRNRVSWIDNNISSIKYETVIPSNLPNSKNETIYFSSYPNPVKDILTISGFAGRSNNLRIEVVCNFGKVVARSRGVEFFDNRFEANINLSHLNEGLFFVKIYDGNILLFQEKIVKQ